jgi:outer membrane protein TolC
MQAKKAALMKSLRKPRALLVVALCLAGTAAAQEPLTLRQAIQQALKLSPDTEVARADTQEATAGAALARTQLLPQLNFTEDISRGNDPVYVFGSRLRQQQFTQADFAVNSLNKPLPINNFSTRFSGQWLAFDSFRTQKSIHGADMMRKSADSSAKAVDQKIVFSVVESYQSVLFAERQVEVAQHELDTAQALLNSVDDRVRAGLAVESDRLQAQVNVAASKQALIGAQGGVDLAWAQLRVAMGVPDLKQVKLQPMEAREFPQGTLDEELQTAAKMRPDLEALTQAQSAQSTAASAAKLSFGPRVSAYGNWEVDQPSFAGGGGNNWVAGVQVGLDILPFSKRAELARVRAGKARVDAQVSSYRQQIRLQVSEAHIQRQTAQLSLETARAAVDEANEGLGILHNRYGAGLATITDLLRAEDAERQAQANYWHAVYGNTVAYAQLLFATGTLTPDAAEVLQ